MALCIHDIYNVCKWNPTEQPNPCFPTPFPTPLLAITTVFPVQHILAFVLDMQYLPFCVWLMSLNTTSSSSMYFIINDRVSFFMDEYLIAYT